VTLVTIHSFIYSFLSSFLPSFLPSFVLIQTGSKAHKTTDKSNDIKAHTTIKHKHTVRSETVQ